MNSPKIPVKSVHPAGGQSRPPLQRVRRVVVGADDSVGPLGSCEFAEDFRKIGASCRADVGIGPYNGHGSAQGFALNKGKPWGRISRHIQLVEVFVAVFGNVVFSSL